jgi:thioredoxin-like negative regulator of GroEL
VTLEVLIFVQPGCPACSEFKPVAQQLMTHYGRCVRSRFVDVHREPALADRMGIDSTPTTIAIRDFKPVVRMVGMGDAGRLARLYSKLLEGASCSVARWAGDV